MSEAWHTLDAATHLWISTSSVRRLCKSAKPHPIPHRWEGGRRVFDPDAVDAWQCEREAWWKAQAEAAEAKRTARKRESVERAVRRQAEKREAKRRALAERGVPAETLARWQARGWV